MRNKIFQVAVPALFKTITRTLTAAVLGTVLAACGGGSPPDGASIDPLRELSLAATSASLPSGATLLKAGETVPESGFWWNPAENGRGFALEVQGDQVVMGAYMYEATGAPTWYLATLSRQASGAYAGSLVRYSGGQTLLGAYKPPAATAVVASAIFTPSSTRAGTLAIQMADGSGARNIPLERFSFSNPAFAAPVGNFQGGLWWNAAESGRGYFIEVQGSTAAIATFMYDANGEPVWYLTTAQLQGEQVAQGALQPFAGGQSLNGAYRAANAQTVTPGAVTLRVTSASTGRLTLPDGRMLDVSRVVAPPQDACTGVRSGFTGNIETVAASAGDTGGDGGGGGSGGGAAAGGGLGKVLGGQVQVVDLSDNSLVGIATTDSLLGLVMVKTCSRTGPFLVRMEGLPGAKYFDEGLNRLVDFPPGQVLHALVDRWDEHVGVSPLTEAAYRYALNNFKASPQAIAAGTSPLRALGNLTGLTQAQVREANGIVLAEINRRLTTNVTLASAKALPTPIDAGSGATALRDSRYGRSAVVNGGLVQAAANFNAGLGAPALSTVDDLARDLTDGRIDGFALDGSAIGAADRITYESGRMPVASVVGVNAVAKRFAQDTFVPQQLRVEEEASVLVRGKFDAATPNQVDCDGFQDSAGLLSDGSVTVVRRTPTRAADGTCSFRYDAAEDARRSVLRNFLTGVQALGRGAQVGYAIKTDGSVWGWGENYCGRLSPLIPNGFIREARLIEGLQGVTAINSVYSGTIARDSTGSVYYWGSSGSPDAPGGGALLCERNAGTFDGRPYDNYQSTRISKVGLTNVIDVQAKNNNFFALTANGDLYGWGDGYGGLLANSNGTLTDNALYGPAVAQPARMDNVGRIRQLAFAGLTAFGVRLDGRVVAWGSDDQKLLGGGTQKPAAVPVVVPGVSNVSAIAGSFRGVRMLLQDGRVLGWGTLVPATAVAQPPVFLNPAEVASPEPIRAILGGEIGFTVLFTSGRMAQDVNLNYDGAALYR